MLIKAILGGALVMGAFTISLFFLRFWKSTQDRFFLYFAASFALEGMSRILSLVSDQGANEPLIYTIRLVAYGLILFVIIEKNKRF